MTAVDSASGSRSTRSRSSGSGSRSDQLNGADLMDPDREQPNPINRTYPRIHTHRYFVYMYCSKGYTVKGQTRLPGFSFQVRLQSEAVFITNYFLYRTSTQSYLGIALRSSEKDNGLYYYGKTEGSVMPCFFLNLIYLFIFSPFEGRW